MSSKLGFYGGVGSVTGANFMLDTGQVKILVDCGLVQGDRFQMKVNAEPFPYDPSEVDFLLVTHAHADHIGRIPKLVKDGFKGKIYSTEPTKALSAVMFEDAFKVMTFESERYDEPVLYEKEDIYNALSLWDTAEYEKGIELKDGVKAVFKDVGHILGSASITLSRGGKAVAFSGDIGNVPQPLLNPPVIPKDYDYLVMESVYGDRLHEEVEERTDLLKLHIEDTIKKQGTLIIPAFSLERTQGMLLEINNLVESGAVPPIATFLDSPLAIAVTDIYRERKQYLKDEVREQIEKGDNIFDFPKLKFTKTVSASSEIGKTKGAKIIIAGSGMSHGGRILSHEKNFLGDPKNILLLVGYQSVGSIGRKLQDGAKQITIDGAKVKVRAKIAQIRGWSGHADRDQLVDFVAEGGEKAKQVFVAMGEERSSLFLVQRLRDYLGVNAVAPSQGEVVEIEF
ncbi:MAG: MBL fold metallo-hydrolase [Candidatus Paceibacterota bacterium]